MRRWFVVGALVVVSAGAGFLACTSNGTSAPPSDDAGSCVMVDASVATQITSAGASFCNTCLQTTCATAVANCAGDCTCNDEAVQALACLAGIGANGSVAAQNDCLEPLAGSSDGFASYLASCILSCAGSCEDASAVDAGCGSVDASITALLGSGSTGCEDCLQSSCHLQANACAQDCTCNAEAVTAVECLANLGSAPSVAAATACVAPVAAAQPDSGLADLGGCLYASCSVACGLATPDAGESTEAGADAGTDASDAAVTDEAGVDAGNDAGFDAGYDSGSDAAPEAGVFDSGVICGGNEQACCAGDSCNPGYHCVGSTCVGD